MIDWLLTKKDCQFRVQVTSTPTGNGLSYTGFGNLVMMLLWVYIHCAWTLSRESKWYMHACSSIVQVFTCLHWLRRQAARTAVAAVNPHSHHMSITPKWRGRLYILYRSIIKLSVNLFPFLQGRNITGQIAFVVWSHSYLLAVRMTHGVQT